MQIVYFKEEETLTKANIHSKFEFLSPAELERYIELLKSTKVLRLGIPKKDIDDLVEEVRLNIYQEERYWFKYVGIITLENICLVIYPKYIVNINEDIKNDQLKFKQILNVIEKYQSVNSNSTTQGGGEHSTLALMIDILRDFHENGLYTTNEIQEEINGEGLINWNKTLESNSVYLYDEIPYYFELITEKTAINSKYIVTQLHEAILNDISEKLKSILSLLTIQEIHIGGLELESMGDIGYLIHLIEKELNNQFITSKQLKLKMLLNYLQNKSEYDNSEVVRLYGSFSFNLVWEDVCKRVYGDDLEKPLNQLALITQGEIDNKMVDYSNYHYLKSVVEKPKWIRTLNNTKLNTNQTLQLDILKINHSKKQFQIYDAKYYQIKISNEKNSSNYNITGQPGVGDIMKQYLYQLAFSKLAKLNDYSFKNSFIIPKDDFKEDQGQGIEVASVEMGMLGDLGLEKIKVIARDCETIFDEYLDF